MLSTPGERATWPRCSRCAGSPSASPGCSPTITSTSTCAPVRCTRSSARTAPARAPSCGCSTGFYRPDAGEMLPRRRAGGDRLAGGRDRPRDRDDPPALHAGADPHAWRRTSRSGSSPTRGPLEGHAPSLGSHRGAVGGLRLGGEPLRARVAAVGGRAPAGRDHQGAVPRVAAARARRAHRRAHPAERWTTSSGC